MEPLKCVLHLLSANGSQNVYCVSDYCQRLWHMYSSIRSEYGLSLLKIHEKYKKCIFHIRFYVSLIKNDKQTKKGKEINIFKSLARSNVSSTKSEEQEVNLVWPNLCIFWLLFICLYHSWSWSLPNFVWMNIRGP